MGDLHVYRHVAHLKFVGLSPRVQREEGAEPGRAGLG